ncbi:MAG: bifunctional D-glycero-beta-D-manno-heptose-7-phosphate kinase/D-glycero-beta-D-manno-heptose 1-phosphate adenylyltransferase HldE [Rhodospirillaceae bacterium]
MTDRTRLISLVDKLSRARVLCLGDVMLDRFVYGRVSRISPEAPIPILKIDHETAMPGGAGNVVRNLSSLGAETRFLSVIGDDDAGGLITRLLADEASVDARLTAVEGRETTIKTRFIAGTQQMLRTDLESDEPVPQAARDALRRAVEDSLSDFPVAILSDYGKGALDDETLARIIAAADKAGTTLVVDPKGQDYTRYRGAAYLTPNLAELAAATGRTFKSEDEIVEAARQMVDALNLKGMLVTRSKDGMTFVTRAGEATHLPAEARDVFDVSGAGDTVAATLAAGLAVGAPLDQAASLANVAAGIVVGKVGTAVVYPGDLVQQLHHQDLASAEAKVLGADQVADRVAAWRRRGLTVGFTNGCFDLLHPGHVSLLRQARAECDRLVVGLNSDTSVKRLKGEDRPVQNEAARAAVLASLASVDAVVLFADDTPEKLIKAVKPDVLVKGADYRIDQVVGRDIVEAAGGRIVLAELSPGHSTTATIRRLAGGGA